LKKAYKRGETSNGPFFEGRHLTLDLGGRGEVQVINAGGRNGSPFCGKKVSIVSLKVGEKGAAKKKASFYLKDTEKERV